jgi:hypothetical protein
VNRIALAMVMAILFVGGATSPPTAAGIPPVPLSLPDLIVSKFELLDSPKIKDDHVEIAVAVGVKNQGTGQAGPFDVEIEYSYAVPVPNGTSTQGRRPGADRVLGSYSIPFTAGSAGWGPLAPGQVAYHKGFLVFPATVRHVTVLLQAVADACHTGPAISGVRDCRVKESNETNNTSARLSVPFP